MMTNHTFITSNAEFCTYSNRNDTLRQQEQQEGKKGYLGEFLYLQQKLLAGWLFYSVCSSVMNGHDEGGDMPSILLAPGAAAACCGWRKGAVKASDWILASLRKTSASCISGR